MNIKNFLFNLSLSILMFLMFVWDSEASFWTREFYSQSVYLHKYDNPITQNKFTLAREMNSYDAYGGVWFEADEKTDSKESYTDSQISPLIGVRSKVFGNEWMFSRFFFEARLVHRTTPFPDDRTRTTYELRPGMMGYGLKTFREKFFLENYYSLFFTRLYKERFIFQGWARQGYTVVKRWEVFNEFFADTFDLTRDSDATYDLRPGLRFRYDFKAGSFQLIHQRIYHLTNLSTSGRNESRSTVVFGYYW